MGYSFIQSVLIQALKQLRDSNHDSSVAMTQLFMCAKDHFDWLNNFGNMRPNPKGNLFLLNCLYSSGKNGGNHISLNFNLFLFISQISPQSSPHIALIISPLRVLMNDQAKRWSNAGISTSCILPSTEMVPEGENGTELISQDNNFKELFFKYHWTASKIFLLENRVR